MKGWKRQPSFPFSLHWLQIDMTRLSRHQNCTSFHRVIFETFSICGNHGAVPLLPFGFSVVPGSHERRTEGEVWMPGTERLSKPTLIHLRWVSRSWSEEPLCTLKPIIRHLNNTSIFEIWFKIGTYSQKVDTFTPFCPFSKSSSVD